MTFPRGTQENAAAKRSSVDPSASMAAFRLSWSAMANDCGTRLAPNVDGQTECVMIRSKEHQSPVCVSLPESGPEM